jgi:serine/threonine-protein kinase
MGVVYDGMHEQLGRSVAIKVLGPGVAGDANAVQRFLREARIASQLTHGNIVEVSDLGTLPDGRPYLVMAKLAGTDLSRLLEKHGPQTPGRTVELLRGAAAALDLVHAKGFVHRDVKPENLMHIVHEDGSEAVLLLDFGIVGLASPDSHRLTAEGVVFGTPCYLAPEVVRGEAPSASSDTYALATVAFELMTGRAPFVSSNVMQLLQLKMSQDPPRMSVAAGFRVEPAVEAVVAKSLSRDPDARHRSPGAFISALTAATRSATTAANPDTQGLDPHARARLTQGTGELELSFDRSIAPQAAVSGTIKSMGPLDVRRLLRKPPQLIAAAAAGFVVCIGVLWFFLQPEPEPKLFTPPPAAIAAEPVPEPTSPSPSPSPSPKPSPIAEPPKVVPEARPAPRAKRELASTPPPVAPAAPAAPAAPVAPPAAPSVPALTLISKAQDELVQGHLAAAQSLYEQATRADSQSAAAFRGLGLVDERMGKKSAALRALRRAIQLAPNDPKNALLRERIERLEAAP